VLKSSRAQAATWHHVGFCKILDEPATKVDRSLEEASTTLVLCRCSCTSPAWASAALQPLAPSGLGPDSVPAPQGATRCPCHCSLPLLASLRGVLGAEEAQPQHRGPKQCDFEIRIKRNYHSLVKCHRPVELLCMTLKIPKNHHFL